MSITIHDAGLRFDGHPAARTKTTAIILHHADAVSCTVEDVHRWHLANGWIGIGYQFFVRKNGEIWQGRPIDWVGAHTKGANEFSVGVCFEGSYESKDTDMPDAQLQAGKELVSYLLGLYPGAAVKRHKDYCSTDCPGRHFPFDRIAQAAAPSPEVPAEPAPSPAPAPRPLLVKGSKGEGVKEMQRRFISLGFRCGPCGADGVYGVGCVCSVKAFQVCNGLTADGKCGAKTWAALDGNPNTACPYPEPSSNVKRGSRGDGARWVQWQLMRWGYNVGESGIDGDCGKDTAAAIARFQQAQGLAADGICGKSTRRALKGV